MIRKISFDVGVANSFSYSSPNGIDNTHLWPIGSPDFVSIYGIEIEFEWINEKNIMRDAEAALDVYMKDNYPNKEYKIYYWNWLN